MIFIVCIQLHSIVICYGIRFGENLQPISRKNYIYIYKNTHRLFPSEEKYILTMPGEARDLLAYYIPFVRVLHVTLLCQEKIISLIKGAIVQRRLKTPTIASST